MADIVKSTKVTRTALVRKLKQGLLASPGETSLSEALDIVEDLERVLDLLENHHEGVLVKRINDKKISLVYPPTLTSIGEFEWDGSESDLGIMIAGMIR